jgi:hypothetical protein
MDVRRCHEVSGSRRGWLLALPSPLYLCRVKSEVAILARTRHRFLSYYIRGRLRVERNRDWSGIR